MQTLFAAAEGSDAAKVPGAQTFHSSHEGESASSLEVPVAQVAQRRSELFVPASAMKVPASHDRKAAQLAWLACEAKVPDGHAAHWRSRLAVPSRTT